MNFEDSYYGLMDLPSGAVNEAERLARDPMRFLRSVPLFRSKWDFDCAQQMVQLNKKNINPYSTGDWFRRVIFSPPAFFLPKAMSLNEEAARNPNKGQNSHTISESIKRCFMVCSTAVSGYQTSYHDDEEIKKAEQTLNEKGLDKELLKHERSFRGYNFKYSSPVNKYLYTVYDTQVLETLTSARQSLGLKADACPQIPHLIINNACEPEKFSEHDSTINATNRHITKLNDAYHELHTLNAKFKEMKFTNDGLRYLANSEDTYGSKLFDAALNDDALKTKLKGDPEQELTGKERRHCLEATCNHVREAQKRIMRQIWDLQIEHDKNIKKIQRSSLSSADFVDQSSFHHFNNYSGGGINIEARETGLQILENGKVVETLPFTLSNDQFEMLVRKWNEDLDNKDNQLFCQRVDSHRKVDFPNNKLKGAFINFIKQEAPQLKTENVSLNGGALR